MVPQPPLAIYDYSGSHHRIRFHDLEKNRRRVYAQPERRLLPADADQYAPYRDWTEPGLYRSTG